MVAIRRTIMLPRISLIKLWEWAGHPPHIVIGVDEYWHTDEAAKKLEREIYADLERRGLAEDGVLSAELRGTLETVARAEAEVHGWVSDVRADEKGGVVVAEYEGYGVRLVCDDDLVRIDPVPVGEVAEYTVQALPRVPGGDMEPFTVERPQEAPSEDAVYEVQVKKQRSRPSDTARLKALEKGPHSGVHQLWVVARVRGEEATSEPLTVLDFADGSGRALVVTSITEDGDQRLSCTSGTYENLVSEIQTSWQSLFRQVAPAGA